MFDYVLLGGVLSEVGSLVVLIAILVKAVIYFVVCAFFSFRIEALRTPLFNMFRVRVSCFFLTTGVGLFMCNQLFWRVLNVRLFFFFCI